MKKKKYSKKEIFYVLGKAFELYRAECWEDQDRNDGIEDQIGRIINSHLKRLSDELVNKIFGIGLEYGREVEQSSPLELPGQEEEDKAKAEIRKILDKSG